MARTAIPQLNRARRANPTLAVSSATATGRVSTADRVVMLGMAAIAVLFSIWQLDHVRNTTYAVWHGISWSPYDEGVYLVSARALDTGQVIFQQVFSSQPPLFLALLALVLKVAGGSAGAGHVYTLGCALMALAGVAWICWEIGGRWAALLGVALLALSPGFVIAARAIEAEAPMLGFGSLAVAASVRYARLGTRRWMILSAVLLACATLSKLLAVGDAAPIALALILAPPPEDHSAWLRRVVTDAFLALIAFAVPILILFLTLSPADQYDQVIRFHLRASQVVAATGNGGMFRAFLGWDPGLIAVAVVGLAVAELGKRRLVLLPLVWTLATVGSMVNYHPLFIHHLTVLLAPLAALGGLAAALPRTPSRLSPRRLAAGGLLLIAGLVYLVWLPELVDHDRHAFVADHNPVTAGAAGWLDAHSGPHDLVVVDDQELAVAADRLVPSALTDTSIVRYDAGYLSLPLLIQATHDPRVRAILLTRKLHDDPGYVAWLRANFQEVSPPPAVPGALAFVAHGAGS
ncbi:MAG TPA: glycosyltransferase family 39 protein [Chloroflexota bacterium]